MKILTISDLKQLRKIRIRLESSKSISIEDREHLIAFLKQLPSIESLLKSKVFLTETFDLEVWDTYDNCFLHWINLFTNLPGWDYSPFCSFVEKDNFELLQKNVIITVWFAPSFSYNLQQTSSAYEIWLKDDGTAIFQLPSLKDAKLYPELYNFKGSWREAYFLLIETLKKGWPMDEFPEELVPLLKK